jgi:hypothetical protein
MRIPFTRPVLDLHCMADEVSVSSGRGGTQLQMRPEKQAAGAPAWAGMLAALSNLLTVDHGGARRARVLLADRFVRYCLIPREAGLSRNDEMAAWARHAFRAEYGVAVDAWRVCVDTDPTGTSVAALIEAELMQGIEDACARAGLRLASLAPHFGAAQAGLARRIRERDTWFAVLEAGHLAAALRAGGTWRHFVTARLGDFGIAPDTGAIVAALAAQSLGVTAAREVRTLHLATAPRVAALANPPGWTCNRWVDPCARPA